MDSPEIKIIKLEKVDSTNEEVKRGIKSGAIRPWTIITAGTETESKGRWGREWNAPVGGLWFSFALGPLGHGDSARIRILSNLAAAESIEVLTGARTRIQWPNNITILNFKVGVTIFEPFWSGGASFGAVGFGINVQNPMAAAPVAQGGAKSLKEFGYEIEPDTLLDAIINVFTFRWNDKSPQAVKDAAAAFAQRSAIEQGTMIEARMIDRELSGAFAGFDAKGNLVLCKPDGSLITIFHEELVRIHFFEKQNLVSM